MSEKNEWLNWIVEAISKRHIDHYEYKHFKNIEEICTDAFRRVYRCEIEILIDNLDDKSRAAQKVLSIKSELKRSWGRRAYQTAEMLSPSLRAQLGLRLGMRSWGRRAYRTAEILSPSLRAQLGLRLGMRSWGRRAYRTAEILSPSLRAQLGLRLGMRSWGRRAYRTAEMLSPSLRARNLLVKVCRFRRRNRLLLSFINALLFLQQGNASTNTFPIDIDGSKLVGHLKKAIKMEKQIDFADVDADKLRLWKVEIPDDHDDQLRSLSLQNKDEVLATKKISKYFPVTPINVAQRGDQVTTSF
ncbi:hypothetical protein RhiirA5_417616 [Rhizophagus irregularis]|uniref:Crinkler effector protein N-terminal domain-containing protein n=1 Tax=Rhizophagus irregularis TaxID=588596 RepID=A0A2N0PM54_9GLOM|nr:hypothetical protein RhiirA5_417616 [Rhizophagus irregularis]